MNYYPFGLKHKGYNNVTSANGNSVAQKFKYNGKEIESPFDQNIIVYENEETIQNRFGGESVTVPGFAAAVYDVIIGSEMLQEWDKVQKGCSWFAKHFPDAYMVLLD